GAGRDESGSGLGKEVFAPPADGGGSAAPERRHPQSSGAAGLPPSDGAVSGPPGRCRGSSQKRGPRAPERAGCPDGIGGNGGPALGGRLWTPGRAAGAARDGLQPE